MRSWLLFVVILALGCAQEFPAELAPIGNDSEPRLEDNDPELAVVILFIGDGMGFEQVDAASIYLTGETGGLMFESFPHAGELTTYSADSSATDSAAASTAIATGVKVNNGVISMAYPGDEGELETLLEYYRDQGKSTGLVTTAAMTHATPASFGAHETSRYNVSEIAADYLYQSRPNVLFGGGAEGLSVSEAEGAGYTVVTTYAEMAALDTEAETLVSGQFGSSHLQFEFVGLGDLPHLSEMVSTALDLLDNNPDGFFLMVEGGRIDHAGHDNNLERAIDEVLEFDRSVQVAMTWAEGRNDTLILVTADHETGGLTVLGNNGSGVYPDVTWSSWNHTAVNVPIYAWGFNAGLISGVMDNTEIVGVVTYTPQP